MYDVTATIGIYNRLDDTVDYIYVKEDGMPDYTSVLLLAEYDTEEKARRLVDNGSINKVSMYVGMYMQSGGSVFKCKLEEYLDIDVDLDDEGEEYRYLFKDGWECYDCYWEDTLDSCLQKNEDNDIEFLSTDGSGRIDMHLYQKMLNRKNYDTIIKSLSNRNLETYIEFGDYIDMRFWKVKGRGV